MIASDGCIQTGQALEHRFGFVDTILAHNARVSQHQGLVEALEQRRAKYPLYRWNDEATGRSTSWPVSDDSTSREMTFESSTVSSHITETLEGARCELNAQPIQSCVGTTQGIQHNHGSCPDAAPEESGGMFGFMPGMPQVSGIPSFMPFGAEAPQNPQDGLQLLDSPIGEFVIVGDSDLSLPMFRGLDDDITRVSSECVTGTLPTDAWNLIESD